MKLIRPPGQSLLINDTSRNYANFDNNQFMGIPHPQCSISPPCQMQPLPPNGAARPIFGPLFSAQPPQLNGERREHFYPQTPCGMYIQESNFCPYGPPPPPYPNHGPGLPVQAMQPYPIQGIHRFHHMQGVRPVQIVHGHPVPGILSMPCRSQARFPFVAAMPGNNVVTIRNQFAPPPVNSKLRRTPSPRASPISSKVTLQREPVKKPRSIASDHEGRSRKSSPKSKKIPSQAEKKSKLMDEKDYVSELENDLLETDNGSMKKVSPRLEMKKLEEQVIHERLIESIQIVLDVVSQENCSIIDDKYKQRLEEFPQLPSDVHDMLHFIDENIQINAYFDAEIKLSDNLTSLMTTSVHLIVTNSPELGLTWILAFFKCSSGTQDCTVLKYNGAIDRFLIVRQVNDSSLCLESADNKDQYAIATFKSCEETQRFLIVLQMSQAEIEIPQPKRFLNTDNLSANSESSGTPEEDSNTSGYVSS